MAAATPARTDVRIAIIGSPRAGKTTYATNLGAKLGLPVHSSDDVIGLGWWQASAEVARLIQLTPGIYEGVTVVRALRKMLLASTEKPVDQCVVLSRPRVVLTEAQDAMRKGCGTILRHIEPELIQRGVEMVYDPEES